MLKKFIKLIAKVLSRVDSIYYDVIYANFRQTYNIAPTFKFNGKGILLYGNGEISIGEHSYVGIGTSIQATEETKVIIGTHCQISHNVRIYTESLIADHDFSSAPIPSYKGDVLIGDYSWIGANVFINPGIVIEHNAVVGANSVVTRDIPANEIWGGVPAKKIKNKSKIYSK
jgi:maltose O-acetyltransferase